MPKRKTTEQFILEAEAFHGKGTFDYSRTCYAEALGKIEVGCNACGEWFWQVAVSHLKHGCNNCAGRKRSTKADFAKKARAVHGDLYDYSKVVYKNAHTKVEVGCVECGESFFQKPTNHIHLARGCPNCVCKRISRAKTLTRNQFIERAKQKHGDRYDYSDVDYKDCRTEVLLTCKGCGDSFSQVPASHLQGHGCTACSYEDRGVRRRNSFTVFLDKARSVHGDEYLYKEESYRSGRDLMEMIHVKCGSSFKKSPSKHIYSEQGCPLCVEYGFNSLKPAVLYYVRFDASFGSLYKIGVTNRTVAERFSCESLPFTILWEKTFLFGYLAEEEEKSILQKNSVYRYDGYPVLKTGNTELFSRDVLKLDRELNFLGGI